MIKSESERKIVEKKNTTKRNKTTKSADKLFLLDRKLVMDFEWKKKKNGAEINIQSSLQFTFYDRRLLDCPTHGLTLVFPLCTANDTNS